LELRRDLRDEGVVRKARSIAKTVLRSGYIEDGRLGLNDGKGAEVKLPRVKLRGVPELQSFQQQLRIHP
jgi:hypothetical protein